MRVQLLSILLILALRLVQGYEPYTTTARSDVQQPKSTPFSFMILILRRIFYTEYRSIAYNNGSTERSAQVRVMAVLSTPSPVTVATSKARRVDSSAGESGGTLENPGDVSSPGLDPIKKWKFPKKYAGDFKKDMSVKARRQLQKKVNADHI